MSFENLNLSPSLLKALKIEGYENPTPIQEAAIPAVLERKDLLGCAQTGTGKTAAFALPILQILENSRKDFSRKRELHTLILAPTRELAIQIDESFAAYSKFLSIKHAVIYGGVSLNTQVANLKNGVDVLIATPGRLIDMLNQRLISIKSTEILVLDEADRMLDMGFINDVKKIIALTTQRAQTLFFSATMPKEIAGLADSILNKPVKIEVTPVATTAEKVNQRVYFVEKKDKTALLVHLLQNKDIKTVLVFSRTKYGADKLVKQLSKANIKAEAIHGNKAQNARQRALSNFKDQKTRVLVATDIAARGIDVDELQYVVNYDLSNQPEVYVHRIGRTGRAGRDGNAYSFCDPEELEYLKDIEKTTRQQIEVADHPFQISLNTRDKKPKVDASVKVVPSSSEKRQQAKKRNKRYFGGNRSKGSRPEGSKKA